MSKLARLLDDEPVQRWTATVATALFPLVVLPSQINRTVVDASAWNWALLMILAGGTYAVANDAITKWRRHFARRKQI
ncbi:hypothetical protein CPI83_29170 (plasmid) [Rhodococcus sp. H-CA8f]|nr:hypothetical protein CPI83_29170 [Rhodococcus sp. H-CA8f]